LRSILIRDGKLLPSEAIRLRGEQIRILREEEDERFGDLVVAAGFLQRGQLKTVVREREGRRGAWCERIERALVAREWISLGMSVAILRAQRRAEMLGGEPLDYVMERRWGGEDSPRGLDRASIFSTGDLGLKTAASHECPFCGESEVEGRLCAACGKEVV
jgi:hypothetical protein